jgi:ubiquinone/menaquinone biosynthesis C-methylase UbiE
MAMSVGGGGVNAEQAQRWNGEGGRQWVVNRERHQAEHQNLTPRLLRAAAIGPGEQVLDVGCGCGETTLAAARSASGPGPAAVGSRAAGGPAVGSRVAGGPAVGGPAVGGRAVGMDLSAPMLAEALRLTAQAGVANAAFVRADAQICPLRPDSCDVVISSFGVMFFEDPAAAFRGIAAAARPGARLAFLCWRPSAENEVFAIPLRALGTLRSASPPAGDDLFEDPRRLTGMLSATGWTGIRAEPVTEPAWIGSDLDDVLGYVRGMALVRRAAAEAGDDQAPIERALAAMAQEYAARQAPDGIWVEAAAWLVTARRAAA